MNTSTVVGTNKENAHMIFKNQEHEKFYREYLEKCRCQDVYHKALVYCIGINEDTRKNVNKIYNFKTGCVNTECLREGWQTSGSAKVVRMAFNLYCNGIPSIYDYENEDDKIRECSFYTVGELFHSCDAVFFWEAVQIRYGYICFA